MADIVPITFEDETPSSVDGSYVIDLTGSPRFSTRDVKFALLYGSLHPSSDDPNPTPAIAFGAGMSDGTTQLCGALCAKDNAGSGFTQTVTRARARSDFLLTAINPATQAVAYNASLNSFGAGTIDLNFSTVTAGIRNKFGGFVLGGDDVEVFVGKTGSMTGDDTEPIDHEIPCPFAFDLLWTFMFGPANNNFDAAEVLTVSAYFMMGAADADLNQHCFDYMNRTAWFNGELDYAMLRDDCIGLGRTSVGLLSGENLRVVDRQSDHFTLRNARTYTQEIGFAAIKLNNGARAKIFTRTIPLTPQEASTEVPGFLPGGIFNIQTSMTALNVNNVDNPSASNWGISSEDSEDNQFGIAIAAVNTADPTDNEHDAQTHGVMGGSSGDAQGIVGDLVSMDALGVTEDYTAVSGVAAITFSIAFVELGQESGELPSGTSGSGGESTFEDTVWEVTFSPRATAWIPCPAPVSGGSGLAGVENVEETGNGFWKIVLDQIPVRTRTQALYFREIEAKLDGRIGVAVLTLCDGKFAPWPEDMSDIEAIAGEAMAVAATSGSIQMINGSAPRPGMQWSTGQRTYRIETVGAVQSGDTYPITFWPKVREAIEDGAALEFVNLKLRCRLEDPAAMHVALETLRFGFPSLTFVEDVLPS